MILTGFRILASEESLKNPICAVTNSVTFFSLVKQLPSIFSKNEIKFAAVIQFGSNALEMNEFIINLKTWKTYETQSKFLDPLLVVKIENYQTRTSPIYVRITIDGDRDGFSTKRFIHPDAWDNEMERVIEPHAEAAVIHEYIRIVRNEISGHQVKEKSRV